MSDHVHSWKPVEGHTANYSCECGATGYRASTGCIREHKQPKKFAAALTVRSYRGRDRDRVEPLIREDYGPKDRES